MKIVFLNPTAALGGAERSLLDLIASIHAHDPSVEMHLIACDDGPLVEEARRASATAEVLPMPDVLARTGDREPKSRSNVLALARVLRAGAASMKFARTLRDASAAAQPDVIHSNGIKTHLLAGMAPVEGVPLVWHVRDFVSSRRASGVLLRRFAKRRPTVIAVSRAVAGDVRVALRDESVPVDVIENAIDTDHFAPGPPANLDALAGMAPALPRTLRVGLVATYARWKGHDLFLDATRIIRTHARHAPRTPHAPVRFYLIGGPIYRTGGSQFTRDELREVAAQRGVSDHVGLIPFQDDPAPVYRALDVVVHASTRLEPLGRTIVEAMACGRAVVVSNEGGAAELIQGAHDALPFRPRDAASLAGAIQRLLGDAGERTRLGAAARATAVERFSRHRLGPQLLAVYRRLLGSVSA